MRKIVTVLLLCCILINCVYANGADKQAEQSHPGKIVYLDDHTFYVIPPDDFDPLTASDAELKKYGLPERPTDKEGLAFWESLYVDRPVFIEPEIGEAYEWHPSQLDLTSEQSDRTNSNVTATRWLSQNWCGAVLDSSTFGTFSGANGVITIPSISADSSHWPAECAGWIGLGGVGASSLAQLGFVGKVSATGAVTYEVWRETIGTDYYTDQPLPVSNVSVSPGDELFLAVWLDYLNPTGLNIYYYYHNRTQGFYTTVTVNVSSYTSIGSTAEWIVERRKINASQYYNLAKPTTGSSDTLCFSSCNHQSSLNSYAWTTASGGTVYNLVSSWPFYLATASNMTNGYMTVTWLSYQ